MARVSYIDEKDHPELAELIGVLRSGRRGTLINVYKLLLHTPALAEAWFNLIGTARWKVDLDGRLREIAIIRVGYLNRVDYVVKQHVPLLAIPEGLTMEECNALADWRGSKFFNARERAALAYADSMTTEIQVPDAVFDALKPHFNQRQIVELTVLIGTYNMHTRVFQALKIDPEPHHT
jgi:4-carboxymuconolactone decarboxylase